MRRLGRVDRRERTCTRFAEPGEPGHTRAEGPHPFGIPVRLPEPYAVEPDTSALR